MAPAETLEKLKDKLLEEAHEVFEAYDEADKTHRKEELADVIEVIDATLYHNQISLTEVLALRDTKKLKKVALKQDFFLKALITLMVRNQSN